VRSVELQPGDGTVLEGRWDAPDPATRVLVFCHPHPLHGGSMLVPLMQAVTDRLVGRGVAVLRFNFRGAGASTGTHDYGAAERSDVAAAVAHAVRSYPGLPAAVAGWSFGAATALAWQATTGSSLPYVGIAPPVTRDRYPGLPAGDELTPAPRTIILGDRDQFSTVAAATVFADEIGADLHVIRGSDHFFHFREDRVAELVAAGIGVPPPPDGAQ
jgi:alpha/beta superfamily hydrolase